MGAISPSHGRIDPLALTLAPTAPSVVVDLGLTPGTRIGQYELIRELGRGGMGAVFAARDTKLGRRVAIKFLLDATGPVAERFMIEARATAQCTHENIVIIHEVGEHSGRPFMVLEFLDGYSLREKLDTGPLPSSRVIELTLAIGRALARASELGIIHRDLKPENVFVTTSGQVKVLDFGIAKARGDEDGPRPDPRIVGSVDPSFTTDGSLMGTLPYMSPEQLGMDQVDHRSDLWAVGIMMHEMLTGRHPIEPFRSEVLLARMMNNEPLAVGKLPPDTPQPLQRLVEQCLRARKVERLASASELVRRLEDLLPGRTRRELAAGECPYPGLAAFQEDDADRFFGRKREIARMVAQVRDVPLSAVVGPSGAGKSSFVRAGLVPALKASGEAWDVITLRPGRQPIAAIASVIERIALQHVDREPLLGRLREEPGYFAEVLRQRARDAGHNILLFVDQFEELYTLVPDIETRRAFTALLAGAADDSAAPLRVVLSMRADFLDRVAEDPRFVADVSRGLLVLGPTDRNGLREALVEPAEMVGYHFESAALVDEMLDELVETPNALPLLQFAASKLWEGRDERRLLLTSESYHASGGVSGALATHADHVISALDAPSRDLARRIFRQLVTPERTRAIAELADLEALGPQVSRVIDQLVSARLLVVQTGVEIIHESLIESWPTLRRWLDEDADDAAFLAQLATSAKQWEAKQRAPGLLWRGEAMEEARRWYTQRPRELAAREQAFLDAVFALARRGKRARRIALVVSFIVLGAIAAGASSAYVLVRSAEQVATDNEARAKAALAEKLKEQHAREEAERKNTAALAALMTEEERRSAAEAGLLSAEQVATAAADSAKAAETARRDAERKQAQAEAKREQAEASAQQHATEAQLTREELVAALAAARTAREKAERASAKAETAQQEAEKAKRALEAALSVERARVLRLEEEKRKLATKLK